MTTFFDILYYSYYKWYTNNLHFSEDDANDWATWHLSLSATTISVLLINCGIGILTGHIINYKEFFFYCPIIIPFLIVTWLRYTRAERYKKIVEEVQTIRPYLQNSYRKIFFAFLLLSLFLIIALALFARRYTMVDIF